MKNVTSRAAIWDETESTPRILLSPYPNFSPFPWLLLWPDPKPLYLTSPLNGDQAGGFGSGSFPSFRNLSFFLQANLAICLQYVPRSITMFASVVIKKRWSDLRSSPSSCNFGRLFCFLHAPVAIGLQYIPRTITMFVSVMIKKTEV